MHEPCAARFSADSGLRHRIDGTCPASRTKDGTARGCSQRKSQRQTESRLLHLATHLERGPEYRARSERSSPPPDHAAFDEEIRDRWPVVFCWAVLDRGTRPGGEVSSNGSEYHVRRLGFRRLVQIDERRRILVCAYRQTSNVGNRSHGLRSGQSRHHLHRYRRGFDELGQGVRRRGVSFHRCRCDMGKPHARSGQGRGSRDQSYRGSSGQSFHDLCRGDVRRRNRGAFPQHRCRIDVAGRSQRAGA